MSRKKPVVPVTRDILLSAMRNIPEEAKLLVGIVVHDNEDFMEGLCLHHSKFFTKAQVLSEIGTSSFQEFPSIPGDNDDLLITPKLYVWKRSINNSQQFPETPGVESYTHVMDKGNPYYDIFYHLDKERKTITFALGDMKKESPVVEHSGWCWKPTAKGLLCSDIDQLERDFLDPFWNPIAVDVGRRLLGIKPVV